MEENTKIELLIVCLGLAMFSLGLLLVIFFNVYKRKFREKEIKLKEAEQEKVLSDQRNKLEIYQKVTEAEQREKDSLAKTLHDTVLAQLSSTERSLQKNYTDFGSEKFSIKRLGNDVEIIGQVVSSVRKISRDLIPPYLRSQGLFAALKQSVEQVGGTFDNQTAYSNNVPFSMIEKLHIFCIFLEIINNLVKHGKISNLTFIVIQENKHFIFEVIHDGLGMSADEIRWLTHLSEGLGLKSIQERVLLLNSILEYQVQGKASRITLKVPEPA